MSAEIVLEIIDPHAYLRRISRLNALDASRRSEWLDVRLDDDNVGTTAVLKVNTSLTKWPKNNCKLSVSAPVTVSVHISQRAYEYRLSAAGIM
jgi:hypothetical protein